MDHGTNQRTVKATETTLSVLEAVQDNPGTTVSELASSLDRSKSTIKYHLATLEENEYVIRDQNEYYLGLKLFELGQDAKNRNMTDVTANKVQELADKTGLEADFSVEEYGRIILLYDQPGSSADPGFKEGAQHYMHTNAAGKAILAEWSDERVEEILDLYGLPKQTENTIGSRSELFEELQHIREQGYAINDEEYMKGHRSMSVVIHFPDGSIHGALTVGGPSYRVDVEMFRNEFRVPLLQASRELEEELS